MFSRISYIQIVIFHVVLLQNFDTIAALIAGSEAKIYATADKSGGSIKWSEKPDWYDMAAVLRKHGLLHMGKICIEGIWLVYQRPHFKVGNPSEYHLLSGNSIDTCFTSTKPPMSMQPIGADTNKSSVILFSAKNFGSRGLSLSRNTGRLSPRYLSVSPTKSIIILGHHNWTIVGLAEDGTRESVCIVPNPGPRLMQTSLPTCLLHSTEFTPLESASRMMYLRKGCKQIDDAHTIILSECRAFGHAIKQEGAQDASNRPNGSPGSTDTEPSTGLDETVVSPFSSCNGDSPSDEMKDLLRFTKLRRQNDVAEDRRPPIFWTNDNENQWKSELIDLIFDIVITMCPDEVVNTEFLLLVQELFMYELHSVWSSSGAPDVDNEEMTILLNDLRRCSILLQENEKEIIYNVLTKYLRLNPGKPEKNSDFYHPLFNWTNDSNLAIESGWIAGNLVSALCFNHFRGNNWLDYVRTVRKTYFEPLGAATVWKSGKDANKKYETILGGFGMAEQFSGLALCAASAFEELPDVIKPFLRSIM